MTKNISLFLLISLIPSLCLAQLFSNDKKDKSKENLILVKDPYTLDDLETFKADFYSGKSGSLETLIAIYRDKEQILSVRLAALDILSESKDPTLKTALQETISDTEFLEIDIIKKTMKILLSFDSLESTDFLLKGLSNSVMKIIDLRAEMIEAIGENNTEDKIITLLDLYEISKSNHSRMDKILSITLGGIDDERAKSIRHP